MNLSKEKNRKKVERYGNNMYLVLSMSIKYVNEDASLVKLLCLNKFTNEHCSNRIYKQALLYSQVNRLTTKRIHIWKCILHLNFNKRDYEAFKLKA
mmetsp:Transcript_18479/g.17591  ORF Transcript_18479/g.17591 Transcript_18479/m.17591 type:complete len:96 (+) Transcript_18479:1970-2257(+)